MSIFDKFDNMFDLEGLKKDIADVDKNSTGEYKEVPLGKYEVSIVKMELKESKKGSPMLAVQFKILAGEFKNSRLFMNQVLTQSFHFKLSNDFLSSLKSGVDVKFESFRQYGQLIEDVFAEVDGKLEFGLEYGENKGFKTFKITDVFEAIPFE